MASCRNYFVGYWSEDEGWLAFFFDGQIHHGDQESAEDFLEFAQHESPDKPWEIVWIPAKEGA